MDRDLILKALNSSGEGSILEQAAVDKIIADLLNYSSELRANLPRKKGSGQAYTLNRRTPLASSSRAAWVDDTDSITEATGSYAQVLFPFKTIVAKGKVTRKLQATGASYTDVLADEIEARTKEFRTIEEDAYINANDFSTDAKKPTGFIKQLLDVSQVVGVTTAANGDDITLEKMDELIDTCKGTPKFIVMSKKGRRKLQSVLQSYQRFVDMVEVKGGFKVIAYNGIPIITSDAITDDYVFNGTTLTGTTTTTANETTVAIAINTDEAFVAELTPVTIKPLDHTTYQYDEFEIFCDEALVVRDYTTCAMLIGFK